MKKHNFLLLTFFSIVLCSCSGMYDNINIYYDEGETNYIAKPDSISTNAGINRVKITWMVSTDPRIENLKVTWDDGAKEATIPIDFTLLDENRYYTTILEGVEEGDHIFKLYHTGNGDISIPMEAEATSYGAQYQSNLTPRPIRSVALVDGKATITWRTLVENCDVEITYTNNSGATTKMSAAPSELTTVLEDAKYGTTFTYVSTYLPEEGSIDVFSVVSEEIAVPKPDTPLTKDAFEKAGVTGVTINIL